MPVRGSGGLVSSWSLLIPGILAALRQKLHLATCPNLASHLSLSRWTALTRSVGDGRLEMTNNAAERGMRGPVLGRKNYLFCGSDAGGKRAACMYTLIETCRMNGIDPQAYLADILARIADHPIHRIDELLPWRWTK